MTFAVAKLTVMQLAGKITIAQAHLRGAIASEALACDRLDHAGPTQLQHSASTYAFLLKAMHAPGP